VLSWVPLLIKPNSRLNSRNYVRDRSTTGNPDNAYDLSSFEPAGEAFASESRQPAVTVTVHRSTISDFSRSKNGHIVSCMEPAFESPKPVCYLHPLATLILILIFVLKGDAKV
jgi:hypothetical protein